MRHKVFYPVLFSVNPLLLLLSANISDVPVRQLFPAILIIPVLAALAYFILRSLLKDHHRAGFMVFLAIFWFFHYGTLHMFALAVKIGKFTLGEHLIFFPLWTLIILLVGSNLIWRRISSPETITLFFNLVTLVVVGLSLTRITMDILPRYLNNPDAEEAISELPTTPPEQLPDIYYLILDGYARADVLQELYQYDNSAFIQELEGRGFIVAGQSQSNYIQTALSLASSLNFEYLTDLPASAPDRGQMIGMINNNRTRAMLEHLGYQTVSFSSGYPPTDITNADIYLSSPDLVPPRDLEALLLINSATNVLIENGMIDLPISRYSTQQERVTYTFEQLAELPSLPGAKFIFAHLIIPHPPYIFDQFGPITPGEFYILSDGDRFTAGHDAYLQGYVNQLIYTNQRVLQVIDQLIANSATPPIIILQADHGPGAYLNWSSPEKSCLRERFSILNAYYLPAFQDTEIPEDISPVNTFRLLFNTYFATHFEMLDNQQYYSTWDNPYRLMDVSLQSQAVCDIP